MKLTDSDLKLVEGIDQFKGQKAKELGGVAILLVIYLVLRAADVVREVEVPIDALLIVYLVFRIGDVFSNIRPESRYVELLRRYVNNDAETITALSERK